MFGPRLGAIACFRKRNGLPTAAADGDDNDSGDDEDGVRFLSPLVASSFIATTAAVVVNLQNAATARLDAWFDFNRDGDWSEANEYVLQSVLLVAGDNLLNFTVPAGASVGTSFARFRVTSQGFASPRGLAPNGEVEDYAMTLLGRGQQPAAGSARPDRPGVCVGGRRPADDPARGRHPAGRSPTRAA